MRNKLLYATGFLFVASILFQACSNEQQLNYQRYFVNGKGLYEKNCQNCHGIQGEGLGKLYPPLTDTTYLSKNRNKIACIIKNGLRGKMTINNQEYESEMPGNSELADIDVAQIIVYVTNSFGNRQEFYEVSEATADLRVCD